MWCNRTFLFLLLCLGIEAAPDAVQTTTEFNVDTKTNVAIISGGSQEIKAELDTCTLKVNIANVNRSNPTSGAEKGEKGEKGMKGDTGSQGIKGEDGKRGDPGPPGNKGSPAEKGERGDRGTLGLAGQQGPRGEQGLPGPKGDIGPPGKQGNPAEKGEKGDMGTSGAAGQQGPRGEQGLSGPKGDPGPPGKQGDPAEKGEKGDRGFNGENGLQGLHGQPGLPGLKGEKGEPGEKCNPNEKITGPESATNYIGSSTNPAQTCEDIDSKDDGYYHVNPADPFSVKCSFSTKQVCLSQSLLKQTDRIELIEDNFLLNEIGFTVKEFYGVNLRQLAYLNSWTMGGKQILKYHCDKTLVFSEYAPEKSLQLLMWNDNLVGPVRTPETPVYYRVKDNNCKEDEVGGSATIEITAQTNNRLPVIDFYIRNQKPGAAVSLTLLELCLNFSED